MRANHNHRAATVHAAAAVGTAMETTTAAAGDLNDVSIHARRWRSQRHGIRNTEGRERIQREVLLQKVLSWIVLSFGRDSAAGF